MIATASSAAAASAAAALSVLLTIAAASPPSSTATRAPLWHRPDLPHAKPDGAPKRIVSLAPVVTETLFLFGAGARVVGDTRFCDVPEEAKRLPKVGGYVDISLEAVLGLKPDLVVAMPSLGQKDVLDRLRERGVPVLVVLADNNGEVHALLKALGDVLATDDARTKAAAVDKRLSDAETALASMKLEASKRAVVVVGIDPLVVAGPHTFAADAVAASGLSLAMASDAPMWPTWSLESLVSSKVDVLVAAEGPAAKAKLVDLVKRAYAGNPKAAPAVVAADRPLLMRPGPALVDDLPELGRLLKSATSP